MPSLDKKSLHGVFTLLPIEAVYYGAGCLSGLAEALAAQGISRALLITGHTLATKTNLVERVMAASGGRIGGVFQNTIQHVHRESVLRATEQARALGQSGSGGADGHGDLFPRTAVLLSTLPHGSGFLSLARWSAWTR